MELSRPGVGLPKPDQLSPNLAMVIEDDEDAGEIAEGMLQMFGYCVEVYNHPHDLLIRVAKRRPDLLIVDVHLPGMDGVSLMRLLRKNPATSDVPVVVTTAQYRADSKEIRELRALDAAEYLSKPFTVRSLRDAIARVHPTGPVDESGTFGTVTTSGRVPVMSDAPSGQYDNPWPDAQSSGESAPHSPVDESISIPRSRPHTTGELAAVTWSESIDDQPDARLRLDQAATDTLFGRVWGLALRRGDLCRLTVEIEGGRAPGTLRFHTRVEWTSWRPGGAKVRFVVLAELPPGAQTRLGRLLS